MSIYFWSWMTRARTCRKRIGENFACTHYYLEASIQQLATGKQVILFAFILERTEIRITEATDLASIKRRWDTRVWQDKERAGQGQAQIDYLMERRLFTF